MNADFHKGDKLTFSMPAGRALAEVELDSVSVEPGDSPTILVERGLAQHRVVGARFVTELKGMPWRRRRPTGHFLLQLTRETI